MTCKVKDIIKRKGKYKREKKEKWCYCQKTIKSNPSSQEKNEKMKLNEWLNPLKPF